MRPLPWTQKGLLLGLLLLLCLPACILVVEDDYYDDHYLHRSRWRLSVIVYYGRSYSVTQDEPYTLSFDASDRLSGYADCNDYDARYETTALGTISIRDIYSTDVGCRQPSLEGYFFESLAHARSYRLQNDALTLTGRGGDYVLYFYRD